MTEKQIPQFRKKLVTWFKSHQRKLPWRQIKDPFHIWVSEVMLQQTQVKTVLEYYEKFMRQFPTVNELASANLHEVLKAWEGMGYYARVRNLQIAARIIVQEHGGKIPANYSGFRKLPGAGEYISAAVLSQAFNQPYAVVDGNVKRVLSRLFLINDPLNSSTAQKIVKEYANLLLDHKNPGMFNQAMMELGAIICRPKNPDCDYCPISSWCQACQTKQQMNFPVISKAKIKPEFYVAIGIIHKEGQILITQRQPNGLLGGLWEFPGGRINSGETAEQACIRKIKEKLNLEVKITDFLTRIHHAYSHFRIRVDVFNCRFHSGVVALNGPYDYRWIAVEEIDEYPFHATNHKFIPLLKRNLDNSQPGQGIQRNSKLH